MSDHSRPRPLAATPVTLLLLVTLVLGATPASFKADPHATREQQSEHVRLVRSGETRVVQARQAVRQRQAQRILPSQVVLAVRERLVRGHAEAARGLTLPCVDLRRPTDILVESLLSLPPPVG
jgi:hypothetical protein